MKRSGFRINTAQSGATLIESLVALFVFAVGALGIAALQTTTLVRSDDLKQRSLAIWKAQEFADRIKASNTIDDPDGLLTEYAENINVLDRDAIGSFTSDGGFTCPSTSPTRCDDVNGGVAAQCTPAQLVEFDVWSVFCDPVTGASSNSVTADVNKLKNMDIAFFEVDGEFNLYMEWWSRSSEQNESLQVDGGTRTVTTDLCGEDVEVDTRVNVYCLRFL